AGNRRLDKRVRRLLGRARMRARATGETATLYGETRYAARRWDRKRRIIMKAEVLCYPGRSRKDNPRFLVTNLPHRPATVYTRLYCGRGDMENRLKELQRSLALDRTSCSRFTANQLRVLLSVAAYVLFQMLQGCARGPALIARGAIAGTPPRAIVSAAELSTLRPLRPSRPLASAFTNNPG